MPGQLQLWILLIFVVFVSLSGTTKLGGTCNSWKPVGNIPLLSSAVTFFARISEIAEDSGTVSHISSISVKPKLTYQISAS